MSSGTSAQPMQWWDGDVQLLEWMCSRHIRATGGVDARHCTTELRKHVLPRFSSPNGRWLSPGKLVCIVSFAECEPEACARGHCFVR